LSPKLTPKRCRMAREPELNHRSLIGITSFVAC